MKVNIKHYRIVGLLVLFIFILGLNSCQDALNEEIYSFIAKENFYQNEDDAESAIIGVYAGLRSNDVYGRWYYDLIHLSDDQVTIHRNPLFIQMDDFNYSPDHSYVKLFWGGVYQVIKYANVAIARIPNIDMDEAKRNEYIAEAKCIRASMYFALVRLWGSVPFTMDEVGDEESANIQKAPVDEIYAGIKSDLEFAEDNLPISRSADEFGRVTTGVAKALLTDVLLTREEWSAAAAKAKEIMNLGQYNLISNFEDIFTEENEQNSEIIYSIIFDGVNYGNWMASFSHAGGTSNANCYNGAQVWQVDENSDMWLYWSNDDPRKAFSIYEEYLKTDGTIGNVRTTSRPYPGFGKWNAPNEIGVRNCPINPIIYRYADVLLMYAEALSQANNGPNTEAYNAINQVRRRAYKVPMDQVSQYDIPLGLSANDFREAVVEERSFEFVVEGKRLFDLMRTGKFPQKLEEMGKVVRPNATLFPIPTAEIEANSSLSSDDQNEGY